MTFKGASYTGSITERNLMSIESALNLVKDEFDAQARTTAGLVSAKEKAVKFQYELRAFVEGEMKRNVDPKTVLDAVIAKLKAVTPHGLNNTCDV